MQIDAQMAVDLSTTCSDFYSWGDRRIERRAGSTAAPGRTMASGSAAPGRMLLNKRWAESGRRSAGACRGDRATKVFSARELMAYVQRA